MWSSLWLQQRTNYDLLEPQKWDGMQIQMIAPDLRPDGGLRRNWPRGGDGPFFELFWERGGEIIEKRGGIWIWMEEFRVFKFLFSGDGSKKFKAEPRQQKMMNHPAAALLLCWGVLCNRRRMMDIQPAISSSLHEDLTSRTTSCHLLFIKSPSSQIADYIKRIYSEETLLRPACTDCSLTAIILHNNLRGYYRTSKTIYNT